VALHVSTGVQGWMAMFGKLDHWKLEWGIMEKGRMGRAPHKINDLLHLNLSLVLNVSGIQVRMYLRGPWYTHGLICRCLSGHLA